MNRYPTEEQSNSLSVYFLGLETCVQQWNLDVMENAVKGPGFV